MRADLGPIEVFEVIARAAYILRRYPQTLGGTTLLFGASYHAIILLAFVLLQPRNTQAVTYSPSSLVFINAVVTVLLTMLAFYFFGTMALILAGVHFDCPFGVLDAFRSLFRYGRWLALPGFATGVVFCLLSIPLVRYLVAVDVRQIGMALPTIDVSVYLAYAVVSLGLFLGFFRFSYIFPSMVLEEANPWEALKRSNEISRGNEARLLAVVLLAAMLSNMLFRVAASILSLWFSSALVDLFMAFLGVYVFLFPLVAVFELYFEIMMRRADFLVPAVVADLTHPEREVVLSRQEARGALPRFSELPPPRSAASLDRPKVWAREEPQPVLRDAVEGQDEEEGAVYGGAEPGTAAPRAEAAVSPPTTADTEGSAVTPPPRDAVVAVPPEQMLEREGDEQPSSTTPVSVGPSVLPSPAEVVESNAQDGMGALASAVVPDSLAVEQSQEPEEQVSEESHEAVRLDGDVAHPTMAGEPSHAPDEVQRDVTPPPEPPSDEVATAQAIEEPALGPLPVAAVAEEGSSPSPSAPALPSEPPSESPTAADPVDAPQPVSEPGLAESLPGGSETVSLSAAASQTVSPSVPQPEPVSPPVPGPEPVSPPVPGPEAVSPSVPQPEPVSPSVPQPGPVSSSVPQPGPVSSSVPILALDMSETRPQPRFPVQALVARDEIMVGWDRRSPGLAAWMQAIAAGERYLSSRDARKAAPSEPSVRSAALK